MPVKRKRNDSKIASTDTQLAQNTSRLIKGASSKLVESSKTAKGSLLPPINLNGGGNESSAVKLQIISGSYEKVLHGFIASIPITSLEAAPPVLAAQKQSSTEETAENNQTDATIQSTLQDDLPLSTTFSDSFLFTAHTSPLRCLALSAASTSKSAVHSSKRILATGAPDERINLYTLSSSVSTLPPPSASSVSDAKIKSSTNNKHLGTLHEHTNTPTSFVFTPNRSKLISAGEDSNILIFRTRDWTLLSTLKVPKPKHSGPAAAIGLLGNGERPSGVNDIALHPSQKILLSVSKGERALRMWNLMTGRKAGVLAFTREIMGPVVGSRIGGLSGEGQKVRWSPDGEEFAVAFERGVVVFGMDSKPRLRILPSPISKVHQMRYMDNPSAETGAAEGHTLAISTEDGRIIFYSTKPQPATESAEADEPNIDAPTCLGQIGGRELGMLTRIKDFKLLTANIPSSNDTDIKVKKEFVVTACSDGTVRIWHLQLHNASTTPANKKVKTDHVRQVGTLVGIYETGRRITCLDGMVMEEGWREDEDEDEEMEGESEESDSEDDE